MRPTGFSTVCARLVVSAPVAALIAHATVVGARQPADICSWLTPAQLEKTLGQQFAAPERSVAPPAYQGQAAGAHCEYAAQQGALAGVVLIGYVDGSAAEAKATFEKLSAFYGPVSKPSGIGDAAYVDQAHAIHVQKGKVRYYISIAPSDADTPALEKQLRDLALAVAAKI
jgi:hypothetical protein